MATPEYWNDIKSEVELWQKIIGKDQENKSETEATAAKIFRDIGGHPYLCIEIGCGIGRLLAYADDYFVNIVGVDISDPIIHFGNRYLTEHSIDAHIQKTDGWKLNWRDERADFVYSFTCFQHMETIEQIRSNISEIFRVLKHGGHAVIQTVRGDNADVGRYDGYVFKDMCDFSEEFFRVGFRVTEMEEDLEWIWVRVHKP